MTPKDYVKKVLITESNDFPKIKERIGTDRNLRLLHGILGLCTEGTELFEMLENKKLDLTNLKEEIADSFWYIGVLIDEFKFNPNIINQTATVKRNEKTIRKQLNHEIDLLTKNVGLVQDLVKKSVFYGRDLSLEKLEESLVQVCQNLVNLCAIGGFSVSDSLTANIKKLKARFKGKFTEHNANNRNLAKERKILEKKY
jgi:NTP pyrophosphatase (non-canonical NTP hydrolase)